MILFIWISVFQLYILTEKLTLIIEITGKQRQDLDIANVLMQL